ncbi:MAG: hypothetical protein EOM80_15125 [Erysipelotrichia bacterium]|nr:hypothetical protein [Erysipelotrichia bacterium]
MKFNSYVLIFLFTFSAFSSFAQVVLPYGTGQGKVAFVNGNNYPGIEEPIPLGPKTFRLAGNDIWVADSIGGKLMQFSKEKGLIAEFSLLASPATVLTSVSKVATKAPDLELIIEDMAPVYDSEGKLVSWWIIDLMQNRLLNYSTDGKKIAELKHEKFVQPFRVEVGTAGHIFVADKGSQAIFVFDSALKLLSQPNWEWSGFAVGSETDTLYRLFYEAESAKTYLVSQNLENVIEKELELDLPEHLNPELWWVNEVDEEFVLTYTPATRFEGKFIIARIGFDGKVKTSQDLVPPIAMNRFIDHNNFAEIWLGAADYGTAPAGNLTLLPMVLP